MNKLASALTGLEGERVALCDVAVTAVLQDLLAEVTVSQTYRNDEATNIEAVYTFPLPLDAVLLELDVEIGERRLTGTVVEKKAAEAKYEDAIESGDAAVMLEVIEPGLYTMNVGNLLPDETARITFRYALLYRWTGERLRLFLPTTIAPRFGESPHLPHQAPAASLTVENTFSLRVEVLGALRNAQFVCPSHAVDLVHSAEKAVLSLQQPKAVMDRDFILNVKAPQATRSFVLCGEDGTGITALASFQPFFPGLQQPRPLALAIVIDCSGSMQGDSMEQAKRALDGILEGLQPEDRITLVAFGSSTRLLSQHLLPCDQTNLAKARDFAASLDATMGGTEIGDALQEAYDALGRTETADIFVVTDGEVSAWETVVDEATKSGHRIFTVGIGSAVSEAFVRALAAGTGGECELVSPQEGMADRVVRHFERMRAPRARRVAVGWPAGATHISPSRIGAVFEGDTVVACASFGGPPAHGSAILEVEIDTGEIVRQELAFLTATPASSADGLSTVARVAAAARVKELDDVAGLETALRYRLVSPLTNWLVIAPRAEGDKSTELPALIKVPQTLAAGWGGMGRVMASASRFDVQYEYDIPLYSDYQEPFPPAWLSEEPMALDPVLPSVAPSGVERVSVAEVARYDKLPPPYLQLVVQWQASASRIQLENAQALLEETGVAGEFDALFQLADSLALNARLVHALVLIRLLEGPLDAYLEDDSRIYLVALGEEVREAEDALRAIAAVGADLGRALGQRAADALFVRQSDMRLMAQRLERCESMLKALETGLQAAEALIVGRRALEEHS